MVREPAAPPAITPAIGDYLKAIYALQQRKCIVTNALLAAQLHHIKASSVTSMLRKLDELGLIHYTPYYSVQFTAAGERAALQVVRHHRLLELFLVEALGYQWDEVHEEADILEHYISEKLEAHIVARLGNPTVDPHGDPIPSVDGQLPSVAEHLLTTVPIGVPVKVVRITDQQAEQLRYLAHLGLVPGAQLEVTAVAPFDGPLSVRVGQAIHYLGPRLGSSVCVEPVGLQA